MRRSSPEQTDAAPRGWHPPQATDPVRHRRLPSPAGAVVRPLASPETAMGALTAADLAELIGSFHEVTARLQATHESLRAEVSRLEGELRDAKGQLRRAEELAALGEMAAGIAHEVRNPLGSIRLDARALEEDLADLPAQRRIAARIGTAVSRLDSVVGDVLDFSRSTAVRAEPVTVGEIVEEALSACADLLGAAGVRVDLPSRSAAALHVAADPTMLHRAMVNIIRNACEAMGEQGPPTRPATIEFRAARRRSLGPDGVPSAAVAIEVQDSGPGIPAQDADRIFNPFFTTRHTGTGLGLAIVHRIVDAHGGRVRIFNRAAGDGAVLGACVELLLPAAPVEKEAGDQR